MTTRDEHVFRRPAVERIRLPVPAAAGRAEQRCLDSAFLSSKKQTDGAASSDPWRSGTRPQPV